MDRFDFYLKWFEKEDERKVNLESSLNIPIGVLTVILTLTFYFCKEFDYKNCDNIEKAIFITFVATSFISSLVTIYFLFRSYHNTFKGFKYGGLPYPTDLIKYEKELKIYYDENREILPDNTSAEEKFKEYLIEKLAELTNKNVYVNDNKSQNLHSSKTSLFFALLFLVLSFFPFIFNNFNKKPEAHKVEIINKEDFKIK